MRHTPSACVIAILLTHLSVGADAPLHMVWMDIDIASCRTETFNAQVRTRDPSAVHESFTTAVVIGTVVQAGYFPSPEAPAPSTSKLAHTIGQSMALSVPDLPAGFCQSFTPRVHRFAYTYHCDSLERKGRCLPPLPDAYLVPRAQ